MTIDDHIAAAKETRTPWNEVREQRVLAAILREYREGVSSSRRNRWWGRALGMAMAAVMVLVVGAVFVFSQARDHGVIQAVAQSRTAKSVDAQKLPTTPSPTEVDNQGSVLSLGDAGRVVLFDEAEVALEMHTEKRIRLNQSAGRARYEIQHKEGRRVEVTAASIQVDVVGTVFTITRERDAVGVDVMRGTVKVDDGFRELLLNHGERIQLSALGIVGETQAADAGSKQESRAKPGSRSSLAKTDEAPLTRSNDTVENALDPERLFAAMDRERASGNFAAASAQLKQIIESNANASHKASAYFTLGKIEKQQGRYAAAARVFAACRDRYPTHPLAEDASAEVVRCRHLEGATEATNEALQQYKRRYPEGLYGDELDGLMK